MISNILFLIIGLKLNMGLAFYILVTIKASIELVNILYKLGKEKERIELKHKLNKSFDKMIKSLEEELKEIEKKKEEEKEKHPEEEKAEEKTEPKQEGNNGEENI